MCNRFLTPDRLCRHASDSRSLMELDESETAAALGCRRCVAGNSRIAHKKTSRTESRVVVCDEDNGADADCSGGG